MALKSTIFKANLQIADIDHGYYADHALTLARHPSETDDRMMVRLVALAIHAHELQDTCNGDGTLAFGAGLSDPDDPDVSLTDFTGRKRIWIEVGQPEDKPLAKACSKADAVFVYAFGSAADVWWRGIENKVSRLDKLQAWRLPTEVAPCAGRRWPSAACSCRPRSRKARSRSPATRAAWPSSRSAGNDVQTAVEWVDQLSLRRCSTQMSSFVFTPRRAAWATSCSRTPGGNCLSRARIHR